MDHVAIMKTSLGFKEKILSGEKKIESRWYKHRRTPWGAIKAGEMVYFKNSGEPVTLRAEASKIIQCSDLSPKKVKEILKIFGKKIGIEPQESKLFFNQLKNKRYCVLVVLRNPKKIKPFEINKEGYGAMASWIAVDKIKRIKAVQLS